MDVSFYTAAVGVYTQQRRLDVHANNLANVNNDHFRSRRPQFSSLMTNAMTGITEDLARGVGAKMESTEFNPLGDMVEQTDRAMDYAISGYGFFGLYDPSSGEYTYTRDGSFTLTNMEVWETPETEEEEEAEEAEEPAEGEEPEEEAEAEPVQVTHWYLSDGLGRLVLGTDGRPLEVLDLENDVDMGKPLPVGVFDFMNYYGMRSMDENRYAPVDKNGNVTLGTGKLMQGYLEMSNVDVAYEFAKVIESQRTFSYLVRMVQTSDEITQTVNSLR